MFIKEKIVEIFVCKLETILYINCIWKTRFQDI